MAGQSEASARFAERRKQEDEAPRLRDVVPDLVSCQIEITQSRPGITSPDVSHKRHVIVDRAPALFLVPCHEPSCRDGGYDITNSLLREMRARQTTITGDGTCHGSVRNESCNRVLHFTATAQYKPPT